MDDPTSSGSGEASTSSEGSEGTAEDRVQKATKQV